MDFEIIEEPIRFHLRGIEGVVENDKYGEVGLRLMDEMWRIVRGVGIPNTGINHWVYLPSGKMFVGVELRRPSLATIPQELAPLDIELPRYLKHLHIGPYQALPQKWKDLLAELASRGEIVGTPSLEIYGHHGEDQAKQETTILIRLKSRPAKAN